MPRGLCVVLLAAPIVLAACGGGGDGGSSGPSKDDLQTVREILTSSAAVQRAVQPVYACPPADGACYRAAGDEIVATVSRERASFARVLEGTDNVCLKEVGGLYDDSLDAYGEVGRAAAAGDTKGADRAISRSSDAEIAYIGKLDECGLSEGRTAAIGSEMRRVNVEVIKLVQEIGVCKDRSCVAEVARRLQSTAREGIAAVEDYLDALGSEAPACLRDGLGLMRQSFESLDLAAGAIEQGDFEAAQREGTKSDELRSQAQEGLASCLDSAL